MNIIQSVLCVEVKVCSLQSLHTVTDALWRVTMIQTHSAFQTLLNEYVWKEMCLFRPEMCLLLEEKKILHSSTHCVVWGTLIKKMKKKKKGKNIFTFQICCFQKPLCYFCLMWGWKTEERRTRWVKWQTGC